MLSGKNRISHRIDLIFQAYTIPFLTDRTDFNDLSHYLNGLLEFPSLRNIILYLQFGTLGNISYIIKSTVEGSWLE